MKKKPKHAKRRKLVNVFGSKLQFYIRIFSWSLLTIIAIAALSLHLEFWLLDIYASYIPQLFLLTITLYILLTALYGRFIIRDGWHTCWKFIGWKEGIMFVASGVLTLYIAIYSTHIITPVPPNSIKHNLTVGTYNKLYTNQEIYQAAYYFEGKQVDILALQEASDEFIDEAQKILGYDYVERTNCNCSADDTEVAIISKYPLKNTRMVAQDDNGAILRSEAVIDLDTTIAIYAVHIPPPISKEFYELRNNNIELLAKSVRDDELKSIIMGDFNTTIYSPAMGNFIDQTKTRVDNISETSWPKCSWFGYGDVFCARIDHIMVSRQFGIGERFIGPGYGSDHRPVVVQLLVN
jgi:endonuclease/exonuclease/phosphatase family metal-dependent hydrolase